MYLLQAILIIHVPARFRNFNIHDSARFGNFFVTPSCILILYCYCSVSSGHGICTHTHLIIIIRYFSGGLKCVLILIEVHSKFLAVKKSSKGVDLLASLCNIYNTSEDELRKTMEQANNLVADILKKTPCLASECETENLEDFDKGLLSFALLSFYASGFQHMMSLTVVYYCTL